jgi:hypothetical protein
MIDWKCGITGSVVSGADNHRCTMAGQKATDSNQDLHSWLLFALISLSGRIKVTRCLKQVTCKGG